MSFILNALRKSEQERQALHPETVTDRILFHQPQQTRNKTIRFFAFLTIGNVLLVACIVWFVRNNLRTTPDSAAQVISPTLPAQEAKVKSKATAKPSQTERPLQKAGSKTTSIAEWVQEPKPEPASLKVRPVVTKKPEAVTIKQPAIANNSGLPVQTAPGIAVTAKIRPDVDLPETISMKTVPVKKDIPFLSDLPFEFRRTVPTFNINVFVYSEHPEESFIMIDMVKYKPGQQIKDAMILKEIRPDSLVVSYQNRTFQIERP